MQPNTQQSNTSPNAIRRPRMSPAGLRSALVASLAQPTHDRNEDAPLMSELLAAGNYVGANQLLQAWNGLSPLDVLRARVYGSKTAADKARLTFEANQRAEAQRIERREAKLAELKAKREAAHLDTKLFTF
jgi:hypothetical protein